MDSGRMGAQIGHLSKMHGMRAAMMQRSGEMSDMSRVDKFIVRNDGNGDGKISISEMADSKLGQRMSVERFEKMDQNGDGMLEAAEFKGTKPDPMSSAGREEAMRERYAAMLSQPVDAMQMAEDVAGRVVGRLDSDGNGSINSEELAGSYLGELVGDGFYDLDADKNGALDQAEISGFVANFLASMAAPTSDGEISDGDGVPVSEPEPEAVAEVREAAEASEEVSSVVAAVETAFEAALEILQDAEEAQQSVDVVEQLYSDVQDILDGSSAA